VDQFFVGPEVDYMRETDLAPDELIVEVQVPASVLGQPSLFLKAAPRKSIDFARGSVAAVVVGNPVRRARVSLGAVAPTPRRAREVESFLEGKRLQPDVIARAAELSVQGARPLGSNYYKLWLIQGLVRQALSSLAVG
jgi:xanthine dehydrogenase YagS FAD-binding subunit